MKNHNTTDFKEFLHNMEFVPNLAMIHVYEGIVKEIPDLSIEEFILADSIFDEWVLCNLKASVPQMVDDTFFEGIIPVLLQAREE